VTIFHEILIEGSDGVIVDCLRALAEMQTSSNGRNYYFSAAKELQEETSLVSKNA
jgi:hypothetical protein